ncbi:MAG TPA: hypothetical protein VHM31_12435 [Polyangia bacterium]|nr:hypothetical protein [Polyangia bacterium]
MDAGTGGDAAASRDPLRWPFATTSIWNMPIGDGAVYVAAGIVPATAYGMTADRDLIVMRPNAPALAVMTTTADWDNTRDRCPAASPARFTAPVPDDFVFAPVLPDTPNASAAILAADGRTLKQTQPFSRCTAGGPATSHYDSADVDIAGAGTTGAHGGSGLSAIGGTLRVGELRPGGPPVRHALKVELDGALNYGRCAAYSGCYRWPATQADSYATSRYGGANPALEPGALLAIPATVDVAQLGLETGAAAMLAFTLQNYGAYVVDDTAWPVYALCVELGPDGDFAQQFQSDWGFTMTPSSKNTPWARDMDRLFGALAVVDNNTAATPGGGGTRLQPAAPPLAM